ncbi:MAG: hypothetical protein IK070_00975 [Clostridia bacterium]|nr:hypothetical protein [Clostridia bacterium]
MKYVIRTLIAVAIVGLAAYLIYFFAFKPSPDISTFNKLNDLNAHEQKVAVTQDLGKLKDYDANSELGLIVQTDGKNLALRHEQLHQVYDYYYGYTSFAKDVKSSSQKAVNKAISAYSSSLDTLSSALTEAIKYHENIYKEGEPSPSAAQLAQLNSYYESVRNALLNTNKTLAALNDELQNFVTTYVFGGESAFDVKACELDVLQQSVKFALENFTADASANDEYDLSVGKFYTKYLQIVDTVSAEQAEIVDCYTKLNVSTTADGTGETYLSKIIRLKYSEQYALQYTGSDEETLALKNEVKGRIFGAGGGTELYDTAVALLNAYAF